MSLHRLWLRLLRYAFHLFYNPFAFTYDFVSAVVSRGRWRAWTRTAIPRLVGTRVLEIPCGTGNLLLDLVAAGYRPIGVDLSSSMLRITRGKLGRTNAAAFLAQARGQALPFSNGAFDSIVMTFPPGFAYDSQTLAEFSRVLDESGRLIWVDAGRLLPLDWWSRMLNRVSDAVDGEVHFVEMAGSALARSGFDATFETVHDGTSAVMVATATKRKEA